MFRDLGGTPQASVIGATPHHGSQCGARHAMCAMRRDHDFRTGDQGASRRSVVPAALALAEKERRSGQEFIRAVTLGYDLGWPPAVGAWAVSGSRHAPPARGDGLDIRSTRIRRLAGAARCSRACALRFPTPRSRSPACGAGSRTRTRRKGVRLRPGWAARNGVPRSAWCRPA